LPLRGMIFHTGRCGSTLLCNALSAADSVMVLKEPLFLSSISVAAAGLTGGTLAERTGSLISRGLGPTRPQQTGLVLKFTSWNILASDFWNTVAPGCPRIFIWRPCAEVMESILAAPAGWATGVERSLALSALEAGLAAVTSGALHGLSVPMKTAMAAWLSAAARGRELGKAGALVIPYAAIQHDFPGVLDRVLQHMGITLSPDSLARAISVRKIYAKDPSGTLAFTPARPRRGLPADLRPVIETTAHELEVALTALGDRPDRSREG
jgi:hypothetical protein